MNKVKILVVEDEIIIADHICDTLEELGYKTLEPAISYTEANETIEAEMPDIAILDIQLAGKKTGIDLAKRIKEKYDFPFIFLTSNADAATVKLAKEVMPLAYLVKPFTKDELFASIEIALSNYSKRKGTAVDENLVIKDSLFIKDKGMYKKIYLKDILYFKSAHVYIEIYLKGQERVVTRTSLKDFSQILNPNFLRTHRSYVVNTLHLDQVHSTFLTIGKEHIPIGKKYKEAIIDKVRIH